MNSERFADEVAATLRKLNLARAEACSGPGCRESRVGMPFSRGERVLDLVSGQEGTIYAGETVHTLVKRA
jgi:hypothetical protein